MKRYLYGSAVGFAAGLMVGLYVAVATEMDRLNNEPGWPMAGGLGDRAWGPLSVR